MSLSARPPEVDDRWRLLDWRNSERVRSAALIGDPISRDDHARWFARLLTDRTDQFLVVEWDCEPVGVVQLEHLDPVERTSSWGCHLGTTEVPPGVGACLPMIGLALGFSSHGLRRMTAEVLGSNRNMLSMHRRMKVPREGIRRDHVRRPDGELVDVHEFGVLRDEYPVIIKAGTQLLPTQVRTGLAAFVTSLEFDAGQP